MSTTIGEAGLPGGRPGTETPVHRRSLTFDAYDRGDALDVVAFLKDERPWHPGGRRVLHHMELRVRVAKEGLVITSSEAVMHSFPHEECPLIAPRFAELTGVRVGSGFGRVLQERFRGVSGCSHLFELARALGSAVFQSMMSASSRERFEDESLASDGPQPPEVVARMVAPVLNTCHIWAPGGAGERKVARGVSLEHGPYPAPAVDR